MALEGPFDPQLGPGGKFKSGADTDIGFRLIQEGYSVYIDATPELEVSHLGYREPEASKALSKAYTLGPMAMSMKHLNSGELRMALPAVRIIQGFVLEGIRNMITTRRPSGLGMAATAAIGASKALMHPIDRQTRLFR
jgi:hypothetical protein